MPFIRPSLFLSEVIYILGILDTANPKVNACHKASSCVWAQKCLAKGWNKKSVSANKNNPKQLSVTKAILQLTNYLFVSTLNPVPL